MSDKWNRKLFIEQNKERIYKFIAIFSTTLVAVISIAFFTYSKFTTSTTTDVVNSVVGDFKAYDLLIAAYINGEEVYTFPSQDDGYVLDEDNSYCDNADLVWDSSEWAPTAKNITKRTKCYLYFIEGSSTGGDESTETGNAKEFMTNLLSASSEVIEDETNDKNIRYVGENPNNYIWFNCFDYDDTSTCERWRIIGLMNNVSTASNGTQSLLKIIRADIIADTSGNSNIYWDFTTTGEYYNIWDNTELKDYNNKTRTEGGATLRRILNDAYYGTEIVTTGVYSSSGSTGTKTYTYSKDSSDTTLPRGITTQTLNKIEMVNWNVSPANYSEKASTYYTTTGTIWSGYIGLMDPSDYGFATSGGNKGRSTCLGYDMNSWNSYSDCYSNSWIRYYNPTDTAPKGSLSSDQWTIRPYSGNSLHALYEHHYGVVSVYSVGDANAVRPVLYLSSDINILKDNTSDGSYASPYRIS